VKLQKLMGDLIEMQNLSNGDAPFKFETQLVLPLMEEILRRNQAYSDIYQCRVSVKADATNLTIHIDTARFYQALAQLLQYALKLSEAKNEIQIRISEERSKIKVVIGIASKTLTENMRKNLSDYFGSHNNPVNHGQYAEGDLGLAIAKEIIEKMHGKIYFENKADDYYFAVEFQQAAKQFA
jgi:K+-sensing histidine kinase KdpD